MQTADGQLIEVDFDDEAATDSDDSDSDGGSRSSNTLNKRQQLHEGDLRQGGAGGAPALLPLPLLSSEALTHAMANAPNQSEVRHRLRRPYYSIDS
jgi:hypothetical protein